MIKEIGSEFWTEIQVGENKEEILREEESTILTLCGRTALEIVIEDIISTHHAESVYMPSYCCHTMIEPFFCHGIKVSFYDVYSTGHGICCDYNDNSCDLVFLIDYFGFSNPDVRDFAAMEQKNGKIIIYDSTQSLFNTSPQCYYDYKIGSFRKWFGVNAGFTEKRHPWTIDIQLRKNESFCNLRNHAFDLKAQYMTTCDDSLKPVFLNMFCEAEVLLDNDYHHYAPDHQSMEKIKSTNVSIIRNRRRDNAAFLINELKNNNTVSLPYHSISNNDCPLFIPVCTDDRDGLKRFLINNKIYCPSHWPVSNLHDLNERTRELYDKELSIICDQRYDLEDMRRVVDCIYQYSN